jgi:signal recognition particle subunit SEC65
MTNGLLISRNTKKILHKSSIAFPTVANVQKYKNYKTIYQRVLRGAKKLYFTSKLEENAKNPKKTWETLNEILGKQKNMDSVEKINIEGNLVSDPPTVANHFNQFFTTIGKQISESVLPVEKNPEDYIEYGREIPDLNLQNTTPEHIQKIIKKLQPKLSLDSQGISTKMIKLIGNEISSPLSHIFNLSLRSGIFPEKLKMCRVIPIFKSGSKFECDNYRPISLLSSISKILEKIVAQKLIDHLLNNDLLYVHQYGFLPNHSTEHNLLQIVNYISKALNDGNFCIGVFLDLKKAFDVCSHEIL